MSVEQPDPPGEEVTVVPGCVGALAFFSVIGTILFCKFWGLGFW
jgi:hypothetical protein